MHSCLFTHTQMEVSPQCGFIFYTSLVVLVIEHTRLPQNTLLAKLCPKLWLQKFKFIIVMHVLCIPLGFIKIVLPYMSWILAIFTQFCFPLVFQHPISIFPSSSLTSAFMSFEHMHTYVLVYICLYLYVACIYKNFMTNK